MKKTKAKKRNRRAQDLTLVNLAPIRRRLDALELKHSELFGYVSGLSDIIRTIERVQVSHDERVFELEKKSKRGKK